MIDPANDVEKASDNKETIVQVVEEHSPHHDADDVPRDRGVFRKAGFLYPRIHHTITPFLVVEVT
jgi:hypothetical protein